MKLILAISILLQFTAGFLAFRLIKVTGRRTAWVLIATAVFFMAIRRCITLFHMLSGKIIPADFTAELVALVTTALMVAGIALIAPLFLSIKRSEQELQKAREELEQKVFELTETNKELDAFTHTVSHDLKAPLVMIGGFINRFMKVCNDKLDIKEKDMLGAIQQYTQKMGTLIKDLLAFSRVGRQEIRPAEIDMGNLVITVLDELRTLSDGRMIEFDIKTLPPGYGDMALIKQVLINLFSNAIKFTNPKDSAVIEMGCKVKENENIYYVKDNGIGFDDGDLDKLFFIFQRLHGNEELEGTGVGLSIVQRIVNRHSGRVWAEGKVNEGATFYFSLPRKGYRHS